MEKQKLNQLPESFRNILDELIEGNNRFVKNDHTKFDMLNQRAGLVGGQKPSCTVLTCADSRVVPEYIFDQGLGQLFVVRNAGNIVVKSSLASIEYAGAHLNCPVLLVLGHQSCGAIVATYQGGGGSESIEFLVDALSPAIESAKGKADNEADIIKTAIFDNIANQMDNAIDSPIIAGLIEQKKLAVIGAYYSFETGQVDYLEDCYF